MKWALEGVGDGKGGREVSIKNTLNFCYQLDLETKETHLSVSMLGFPERFD